MDILLWKRVHIQMDKRIQIRPAQPTDAKVAAPLLYSAYTHILTTYPLAEEENGFLKRLEYFFSLDGNRFSYQNTIIAEYEHQVAGLILSFAGREEIRLNAAIEQQFQQASGGTRRQLEREAADDDALAVFTNWGGRGIGTQLLLAAEQAAIKQNYKKISLNVAKDNKAAFRLYQGLHYSVTGETILYQQEYIRMVKEL
jgi:ribosomal protein S18 acetylase RimI-like enzyme